MKRVKSHFQEKEPILESLFQNLRFKQIEPFINRGSKVLDLGCGFKGAFLKKEQFKISEGVGYDISVTKDKIHGNVRLFSKKLDGDLKLPPNYFDLVTSLAVIEHLKNPQLMINQVYKTLKKDGVFVLTTPSPKAKPILEFLAFKMHIVSEQEIKDHKEYYSQDDLLRMLVKSGFQKKNVKTKSFSLGYNTLAISKK
jgi:2-polyprenyl-3-methyl-5-hydroxy-6-metoxy-1,4-benzoquinol methylase